MRCVDRTTAASTRRTTCISITQAGGLYAESQLRHHADLLNDHMLGNPHSGNLSSTTTTRLVEQARRAVLEYFNASPAEYTAVFTLNATAALKLVGESYPFAAGGRFLLTFDNHNSVNGIREFARAKGAAVEYAPLTVPDLRIDRPRLGALLDRADNSAGEPLRLPRSVEFLRRHAPAGPGRGGARERLGRAAGRGRVRADQPARPGDGPARTSSAISFYKMFGYPTGVGCLLVRHRSLPKLTRPWFAGGTVNFATVQGRTHILAPGEAGFEDGTLNYLSIPGGRDRTAAPAAHRHRDDPHAGPLPHRVAARTSCSRCGTATAVTWCASTARPRRRCAAARSRSTSTIPTAICSTTAASRSWPNQQRISLRTGCFCNPGAGEMAEGLTESDMLAAIEAGGDMTLPRFLQVIQHRGGKSAGAIRVSLGLVSNFGDVVALPPVRRRASAIRRG